MRDLLALIGIALLGIVLIIAGLLLIVTDEAGATVLMSDPASDNATSCVFESFPLPCTIDGTKAIKVDISNLTSGPYTGIRAKFCVQNGLWCSAWSLPLSFTKPSINAPLNIKLSP